MTDWLDEVRAIATTFGGEVGPGCSEARIAEAERRLAVEIRGGFRDFLREFGWVHVLGHEYFGLGATSSGAVDLVDNALSEWAPEMRGPRRPLLPVCALGNGDSWCEDLGSPAAEPPVVDWCHELADEDGYVAEQVADGYAEWIVGRLREMVEQKRGR